MLLAFVVLVCAFFAGHALAARLFKTELFPYSLLLGSMAFSCLLYLLGIALGFGLPAILLSSLACLVIYILLNGKKLDLIGIGESLFNRDSFLVFICTTLALAFFSNISISYENGFSVATQDFAFHLGIINTMANGNFPPAYPGYSPQRLTYYYFPHILPAALRFGGLDSPMAFQLFLVLVSASFICAFYCLSRDLLGSPAGGLLAIAFLFIVSPCTGCQHSGASWFSPFYPPDVAKMLISGPKGFPFAPTMLSFPISQLPMAFAFLFLAFSVRFFRDNKAPISRIQYGLALAAFPMFHTFFFLILLGIFLLIAIIERKRAASLGLLVAAAIGGAQFVFLLSDKAKSALAGNYFHYELFAYSQGIWDLLMFWVLNAGGHILLAALGLLYLWKRGPHGLLPVFLAGAAAVFIFGNMFILTPYRWDANKLFLPFLLMVSVLSAAGIFWLWEKNTLTKAICGLILLLGAASSYYHFFIYFDSTYEQTPVHLSSPAVFEACKWAKIHTDPKAIFLADDSLEGSSCLYAYSGRMVLLSIPQLPETHGFSTSAIKQDIAEILAGDLSLAGRHGVTHVFADSDLEKRISPELRARLLALYSQDGVSIYSINYP